MNRHELDAPEVSWEQIAYDSLCFNIKRKPYGALTGAVIHYKVKWKEHGSLEEKQKLFDNPNLTKLEINGLKIGIVYDFSFESGSRLRFGKASHKKGIILDNWRPELFATKLHESNVLIGRLNEWTDNTVKQMLERVFSDEKSKLFGRRRSSIFSRLTNSVKFCSKPTKGIYIAFMISHKNKIVLTNEKTVPIVRIDKSTSHISDNFIKWFCRLPRHQQDLLAIQRINEECSQEEGPSSSFSMEREVLKTLLILLMLTSYDRFDFYHFKPVQIEETVVLVVGARGQAILADNLQWYSQSKQTPKCDLQEDLLKIGQFYEQLRKPLKPGLYLADLRLMSDVQQIYVQTCQQNPAYLPCTFIRPNHHVTKQEWSWLNSTNQQAGFGKTNSDQLTFYRQFFQASTELFERYNQPVDRRQDYCVCNEFLLEYGQVSMILIYPGSSNIVSFKTSNADNPDNKTQLLPGPIFEREYLRHVSNGMFEKYSKVRSYMPVFKEALKIDKMQEKRIRVWSKSVAQNVSDADEMLKKFDADISWLNSIVSKARKNDNTNTRLCQLQQQLELLEILNYSQSFIDRKTKLTKINVVMNFKSLYPPGTAMLIQIKTETTVSKIVQLILERSFTKEQLSKMSEDDFYLAVNCGMRERRLRSTLNLQDLDEPWVDGEFCIRQCILVTNQGDCLPSKIKLSNNSSTTIPI